MPTLRAGRKATAPKRRRRVASTASSASSSAISIARQTRQTRQTRQLPQEILRKQSPSYSALERLPAEILVSIMDDAVSVSDLYALISASPSILSVFLSAKRLVLLRIARRALGPAMQDAIAATVLVPGWLEDAEEAMRAIQQYALLRHGGGDNKDARTAVNTDSLSDRDIAELVKTGNSVQYLVDKVEVKRRAQLSRIHHDTSGPLTTSERCRLTQSLLRHQFMARICIRHSGSSPHNDRLLHEFFGLFKPWEIHQLSDMHSYAKDLLYYAFERGDKPSQNTRAGGTGLFGEEKERAIQRQKRAVLCDLGAIHRMMKAREANRAPPLHIKPLGGTIKADFKPLAAGPLPSILRSDLSSFELRGRHNQLYRREEAMPPLVFDVTDDTLAAVSADSGITAAPFAWVDGHGGRNCQRWGQHVRREMMSDQDFTWRQQLWMSRILERWRRLGFSFWDRDRVELLKAQLLVYETGWLTIVPPNDSVCMAYIFGEGNRGWP